MADTVLVVDDDVGLQETLAAVLQLEGYDVVVAGDGLEALAKLSVQRPAVIVLDWAMPRMDGPAFTAALQQRGLHPGIPVLLLTADGRAHQKAAQVGADGCMAKPFEITELLDEVARLAAS
ncbi:MAG TPA: response regulator [Chloroflexota bacterium]|nr:response regulator [Chloroflexota bacterium]